MPEQTMETLRLITNLETEKRKLLHVVLFGQPELDERLAQKSARQLRQRITFSYILQPIDAEGIAAYLQHRLLVAGGNGEVGFDSGAVKQLYRGSGGFPRLINILAHKALMLGYGQGVKQIGAMQVKAAIADTEGAQKGRATTSQSQYRSQALSAVLALALLLVLGYQCLPTVKTKQVIPGAVAAIVAPLVTTDEPTSIEDTVALIAETESIAIVETNPTVESLPTPRLNRVTPSHINGGWDAQLLLLHGESLPMDARIIVSWAGREKLLPPEQVKWLDNNTLQVSLTTGVRSESWQLQLVHPDGLRSDAVTFDVVAPNQ